jgi:hypothetical protein
MSTSPDGTAGWNVNEPSNALLISSMPVPIHGKIYRISQAFNSSVFVQSSFFKKNYKLFKFHTRSLNKLNKGARLTVGNKVNFASTLNS